MSPWLVRVGATLMMGALIYGGVVLVFYIRQRALLFERETLWVAPAQAGLPEAQEVIIRAADGITLILWVVEGRPDKPWMLYLPGHAGRISEEEALKRYRLLRADGAGLVVLSYRGYGGSQGDPDEQGLLKDAEAAYQYTKAKLKDTNAKLIVYGESLGSALAVDLAAKHEVDGTILEAPFTSIPDVVAHQYPFLPPWLLDGLVKDPFRSVDRIAAVHGKLMILHGTHDKDVPPPQSRKLFELATGTATKEYIVVPGGQHDLFKHTPGVIKAVRRFSEDVEAAPSPKP